MSVENISPAQIGAASRVACCELWATVFTKAGRTADTVAEERQADTIDGEEWHVVWHQSPAGSRRVVAACRTFPRVVRDGAGKQRRILALAHVASDPDMRGVGVGKQLVTAALSRVSRGEGSEGVEGDELEAALFQTAVAPFYEKLGAVQIQNEVVNSTGEGKDEQRQLGFWDPQVMLFPASAVDTWPEGPIDLLGPGY